MREIVKMEVQLYALTIRELQWVGHWPCGVPPPRRYLLYMTRLRVCSWNKCFFLQRLRKETQCNRAIRVSVWYQLPFLCNLLLCLLKLRCVNRKCYSLYTVQPVYDCNKTDRARGCQYIHPLCVLLFKCWIRTHDSSNNGSTFIP
jgi:hypothetical protein